MKGFQTFHVFPKEEVEKLVAKLKKRLEKRQETLESVQQKRANALRGWSACQELLASPEMTIEQQKWLALRKSHLELTLQQYSALRVLQLEAEVEGMLRQLRYLDEK